MKKRALATALSVLLFAMSGISVLAVDNAETAPGAAVEAVAETTSGEAAAEGASSDEGALILENDNLTAEITATHLDGEGNLTEANDKIPELLEKITTPGESESATPEKETTDSENRVAENTALVRMMTRSASPVVASMTVDPNATSGASADPSGAAGTGASVDPNAGNSASVDPNAGNSASVDPNAGTGASADPNAGTGASVDPNAGTGASVDPNAGTGASVDPNAGSSTEPMDWTVETSKSVDDNGDGTYLLKISVSANGVPAGSQMTTVTTSAVDIIYVVDESSSMKIKDTQAVKDAVRKMTNEVGNNQNVQFALVGFGEGYTSVGNNRYNARILSNLTNKDDLLSHVDEIEKNGWTPMDDALIITNEVLKTARPDSRKVVVVLCDGGFSSAKEEAEALMLEENDMFYAITVNRNPGKRFNTETWDWEDYYPMEDLKDQVVNSHTGVQGFHMQVQSASLVDAFGEIAQKINNAYQHVRDGHLTDVLSDALDFAGDDHTLTVFDENGNAITLTQNEDGSYTLPADTQHNPNGGTVRVVKKNENGKESIELIFSDGYQLENKWTYALSTLLRINPEFAAAYAGATDGTSDAGTGTYALQDGVWTNINAESVFTFTGNYNADGSKNTVKMTLQKPVIQLNATPVTTYEDPAEPTEDTVYVAPEAPEVMGAVRAEDPAEDPVEDPIVLGARRNARTSDFGYMIPVILLMLSVVTFIASRKMEKEA